MTKYVALLRGITPSNPNMQNEKLRNVFEKLGLSNVQTVISSGNVLFESPSKDVEALEAAIERALYANLGFTSTTIIRSQEQLQAVVDRDPFKGIKDTPKSRLNVTFLKKKPSTNMKFPYHAEEKGFSLLALHDRAICSVTDLTRARTPDLMLWLEKEFGKEITTRTWNTVMKLQSRL